MRATAPLERGTESPHEEIPAAGPSRPLRDSSRSSDAPILETIQKGCRRAGRTTTAGRSTYPVHDFDMRRSTMIAAAVLPALLTGFLFSANVHASSGLPYRALLDIDDLARAASHLRFELAIAFLALTLACLALLAVRALGSFGRRLRGPMLRMQEEID